jgi:hypothetical protein
MGFWLWRRRRLQYFPLTSSWETDNWTLFIDERQHDVNGTMTKAMVDTSEPTALYWTCDDDGLRLHRYIDEDEGPLDFSPPILIAAAVAEVGDRWEGTYTATNEDDEDVGQIKITSEIVGIEDVSVPAGNFADCFKLEVAEVDQTDDSLYWKETWWLAEGVGLVKIVYSPESVDEDGLFASEGETIQLLGYHITPSDLTDDEKKIKELRADFSDAWEQENLAAMDNLYSNSWSARCRDKTARMQEWTDFFANNEAIANFGSISDIVINGNEAKCMVQRLSVGIGDDGSGSEWVSWGRSTDHMIKEGDEWKYYGSHQDFTINWRQGLWTRQYPDENQFLILGGSFTDCDNNRIEVDSFTVTGPPGTFTDLDLTPYWDDLSPDEYFMKADIIDATDGFYTHTVGDADGNIHQYTDYLEVFPILAIPNLVSPIGDVQVPSVNVTLIWDQVPEAQYYRIELMRDTGGGNWVNERDAYPGGGETQVNFDNLPAESDYRWRVRPRQNDTHGDWDNETRSDYEYFSTP